MRGNFLWADVDPLSASIDGYLYSGAFGTNGVRVFAGRTPSSLTNTDVVVVQEREQAVSFCFGDGSGSLCPCGNGAAGRDCPNSANPTGAGLVASGDASLASDTIALQGFGMLNGPALYYQGTTQVNAGQGSVFGDGLQCAGGSLIRLGTKMNVSGTSQYPVGGDASVSVKGSIVSPGTRTYQVWYRNSASFCTISTFNLTNGLEVIWVP